jgi:hypothetical protein
LWILLANEAKLSERLTHCLGFSPAKTKSKGMNMANAKFVETWAIFGWPTKRSTTADDLQRPA